MCLIFDDFVCTQRLAEEKKKLALKRQEELEQKRKLEEEAKKKKIQQAVRHLYFMCWCVCPVTEDEDHLLLKLVSYVCFLPSGGGEATAGAGS